MDSANRRICRSNKGFSMNVPPRLFPLVLSVAAHVLILWVIQPSHAGPWTTNGPLILGRYSHTATLLPNGQVLIAGGLPTNGLTTNHTELFDPVTGTSRQVGAMAMPRRDHTATLMLNGKVLVAGGINGNQVLAGAELYDPVTETWSQTTSM